MHLGHLRKSSAKQPPGEETEVGEEVAEREAKTKGMFAAFKEEFDKAKAGDEGLEEDVEEEYDEEVDDEGEALVEEADEGEYEEPEDDEYEDDDADEEPSRKDPGIGGMFAAFKSEFDKAAKGE